MSSIACHGERFLKTTPQETTSNNGYSHRHLAMPVSRRGDCNTGQGCEPSAPAAFTRTDGYPCGHLLCNPHMMVSWRKSSKMTRWMSHWFTWPSHPPFLPYTPSIRPARIPHFSATPLHPLLLPISSCSSGGRRRWGQRLLQVLQCHPVIFLLLGRPSCEGLGRRPQGLQGARQK